jgi:hypothetical protein
MSQSDDQLVQMITQQVLAVLRERGMAVGSGGSDQATSHQATKGGQARAEIHPPIGVCTGDYSKFPELRGKLNAPQAVASAATPAVAQPAARQVMLEGFVTAAQLQAAIDASPDGVALLSRDAKLTPLGNDFVRKSPAKVRRLETNEAPPRATAGSAAVLPWTWWIDGQCPVVQRVTNDRRGRMVPTGNNRSPRVLPQVVRDFASGIKLGRYAGGFLFVHNAARAICMANRCASIRAIVGTCGEAVEQGIADLGANVLLIEYPHVGQRAMSEMVDRMMQHPPAMPAGVERDLTDLHRCG